MLPQSWHVAKLEIDDLDLIVLCKFHNIAGSFDGHGYFLHEGEERRITSGLFLPTGPLDAECRKNSAR
jgi:hypothetical protein